jgi:hypothetical protein
MNGRKLEQPLVQFAVATLICALSACAHAPAAREQMSILDTLGSQQQPSVDPTSCAARNATFVCEKSTRLDVSRSCRCVDPRAFDDRGGALRL